VRAIEKMTTSDYYKYKSAIEAANDSQDREALRQIQKQLIAKYGLDNDDVKQLLRYFKYSV
jgi:hypothetical protein